MNDYTEATPEQIKKFRRQLRTLFEHLNKRGIFAAQHCACCNTCGWDDLMERYEALEDEAAEKVIGFAYTHGQDRDCEDTYAMTHIGYGNVEGDISGEEVAAIIVEEVGRVNWLKASWDGTIASKVKVRLGGRKA